jgi:hypothetical protein
MYVDDTDQRADTSHLENRFDEVQVSTMRNTALALKDEYDEVLVSAPDEAGIIALRGEVKDLRSDLRAMAIKAANDLKELWDRIDRQLAYFREDMREMRAETKQLRERLDTSCDALNRKIDGNYETLHKKIDNVQEGLNKRSTVIRQR